MKKTCIMLNLLDSATTYVLLSRGAVELNPLISLMIASFGLVTAMILKSVIWSGIMLIYTNRFIIGVYAIVVLSNVIQLLVGVIR